MKAKVVAALLGACIVTPVLAQSNVTIYGLADGGLQISRFGKGTQYNLASGMADGSRFGFHSAEDLGDGYKAFFTLEGRFELDTGSQSNTFLSQGPNQALTQGLSPTTAAALQPLIVLPDKYVNQDDALFDRQVFVGLSTPFGSVLFGRQYTPGFIVDAMSDTFETGTGGSWGSIMNGNGGAFTPGVAIRANNAVQYLLKLANGVSTSLMYAKDQTGSLNLASRFVGGNVTYLAGGLNVGIGYNNEQDQNDNASLQTLTMGGSYTMEKIKLFAGYHRMKNGNSVLVPALTPIIGASDAAIVGNNATVDGDVITVGAHYHIGAGRIMAAINHFNDKKAANGNATSYGLGYDYNLSKRTDVYTVVSHISNQNTAQYAIGGAGYSGGSTYEPGQNANAIQMGVRHRF
jgi:GBP family porin